MKTPYTEIVETKVTKDYVELKIQPSGTDWGYDRITVHITPNDNGLFIHFAGLDLNNKGRKVSVKQAAANQAEISYVPDK